MDCKNHMQTQASYACSSCGEPLCVHCTVEMNKKVYCKECLEKELARIPFEQRVVKYPRKSKFLTFCFGFIPGAGHMYLGLMTKGLLLMTVFFFTLSFAIVSSEVLGIHWLPALLIPTVCVVNFFYSIFDALAMANEINSGRIVRDTDFSEVRLVVGNILSRTRVIGLTLVTIGFISILNMFSNTLESFMAHYFNFHFSLMNLIVPVLLILLGLYMLQRSRRHVNF